MAIKMIADMRPDIYFVFEQPAGSWGFKQTFMLSLMASLNMLLNLYTPSDKFFSFFPRTVLAFVYTCFYCFFSQLSSSLAAQGYAFVHGWACLGTICTNVPTFRRTSGPPHLIQAMSFVACMNIVCVLRTQCWFLMFLFKGNAFLFAIGSTPCQECSIFAKGHE